MSEEGFRSLFQHIFGHPLLELCAIPRDVVPGNIETVGSLVITLRIGRIGAPGDYGNCRNSPRWKDHCVVTGRSEVIDLLLYGDDGALCCQHGLLLHSYNSVEENVA